VEETPSRLSRVRSRKRQKDATKMDLKEVRYEGWWWIQVAKDCVQ
jgi:hypothetical protein